MLVAFGLKKRITLKDSLALCLLLFTDFLEEGSKSYHASWFNYPTKFVPYGRTIKYWEKLTEKKSYESSTYYRLKQNKVFTIESEKIKIDLNTFWWREFLNYRFRFFSAPNKWNHQWIVILYDIPEKHRFARDNFRQVIESIGFACWQRSVWLTINPVKKLINDLINNFELDDYVTVFTAQNMFDKKDLSMIKDLFQPEKLEKKYQRYIDEADFAIKSENKQKIKSMVDNYPNLIFEDSGLPEEFFTQADIRKKVVNKYKNLLDFL